jgi:hypothetical protein
MAPPLCVKYPRCYRSAEPSIQWKVRAGVMNEDPRSKDMRALREDIRNSARVKTLLAHRDKKGRLISGRGVYDKWQGAHWILAATSTFIHTIHSLRGLHLYGSRFRNRKALAAAKEASELFLSRRLHKRKSNGAVIKGGIRQIALPAVLALRLPLRVEGDDGNRPC